MKEKENKDTFAIEDIYEELNKSVFSEEPFKKRDKDNEIIFKIISKRYHKLLVRCPLYKQKKINANTQFFKTFMKVDSKKDNVGRSLRLIPIKDPLKLPSISKGLSFMRELLLKKALLSYCVRKQMPEAHNSLLVEKKFYFPDDYHISIIQACLENLHLIKKRPSRHISTPQLLSNFHKRLSKRSDTLESADSTSNSQLSPRSRRKKHNEFDCEIIKVDSSYFGTIKLTNKSITYLSRTKPLIDDSNLRLGSTKEMLNPETKVKKKKWNFSNIDTIILRRYNFIKQAFEMKLTNKKTVFILLFSKESLDDFIRKLIVAKDFDKKIREYEVGDAVRCIRDGWKKKEISNFDYLMKLNDFSGRTFECMSQYPVFPWVIQNYSSTQFDFSNESFRDFKYPMAGISEKKRLLAEKKISYTEDMPGGVFQYGSHYLPGRAVLGYLLRLQPYTQMIYKFDSGGDCSSRHFHIIKKRWEDSLSDTDMNIELIPEFFYNPEFLANQ